jgi:hypothetical protein
MTLESTIESYLKRIGQSTAIALGPKEKRATREDSDALASSIAPQSKGIAWTLRIAVAMLCAIFLGSLGIIFYYRDDPTRIGVLLGAGGGLFSLLAVIRWLRRLWIEENTMEFIRKILDDLPPEKAAEMISQYYFMMMGSKRNGARDPGGRE